MSVEQRGQRLSLEALFDSVKETVESMFSSGSNSRGSKRQGARGARHDQELASLLRGSSASGSGVPGASKASP
ncbi:MAG: hypothetical protein ABGY24_16855, partial [bacterium]